MSTTTTQIGNLQVTTHVAHTADGVYSGQPQSTRNLTFKTSTHFKKIPVKALSTLLMLTGFFQCSMGFIHHAAETSIVSLTLKSGVYFWGGIVVFIAGCASLAAILKDTINTIKVCMACNITNIVIASIGLILFTIQICYETQICWIVDGNVQNQCEPRSNGENSTNHFDYYYHFHHYFYSNLSILKLRLSINIIIVLFSTFGLIVSCFMTKVSDNALKSSGYSLMR